MSSLLGSSTSSSSSTVHQTSSPFSSSILSSSPSPSDHWFFMSSGRDNHNLTEGLTCELNASAPLSYMQPISSRSSALPSHFSKSLVEGENDALLGRSSWQSGNILVKSVGSLQAVDPGTKLYHQDEGDLLFEPRNHATSCLTQQQAKNRSVTMPTAYGRRIMDSKLLLSSQGSVDVATSKVSKRRSRPSNKVPITVLTANTSNFRDMVQQLTGIPSSPPSQKSTFQLMESSPMASSSPLLKPLPTRPVFHPANRLPTMDATNMLFSSQSPFLHVSPGVPMVKQLIPFSVEALRKASQNVNFGLVESGTCCMQGDLGQEALFSLSSFPQSPNCGTAKDSDECGLKIEQVITEEDYGSKALCDSWFSFDAPHCLGLASHAR